MKRLSILFLLIFFVGCIKEGVYFTKYTADIMFIIQNENNCDSTTERTVRYAMKNERHQTIFIDTVVRGDFFLIIPFVITAPREEIPLVLEWRSDIAVKTATQIIYKKRTVAGNMDGNCRFSEGPGSTWSRLSIFYDPPE